MHKPAGEAQRERQMQINFSSSLILFSKQFAGLTQILDPLPIGFAVSLVLLAAIPITGSQLKKLGAYCRLRQGALME